MKVFNFIIVLIFFCRANNNWETYYSTLTKSNENSAQSNKKQRECGESARDSLAYSCLLKNELLGASIEDIKNVSDDSKMGYLSNSNRGLFKYQPPSRQVINHISS
jgi:cell division cycle 20-like protein 1, cofactor of APC complex